MNRTLCYVFIPVSLPLLSLSLCHPEGSEQTCPEHTNWSSSRPSKIRPCKTARYNNIADNPTAKNMPASSILRVFAPDVYFTNLKLITYNLEETKQRVSLMASADGRPFERRYGVFSVTTLGIGIVAVIPFPFTCYAPHSASRIWCPWKWKAERCRRWQRQMIPTFDQVSPGWPVSAIEP